MHGVRVFSTCILCGLNGCIYVHLCILVFVYVFCIRIRIRTRICVFVHVFVCLVDVFVYYVVVLFKYVYVCFVDVYSYFVYGYVHFVDICIYIYVLILHICIVCFVLVYVCFVFVYVHFVFCEYFVHDASYMCIYVCAHMKPSTGSVRARSFGSRPHSCDLRPGPEHIQANPLSPALGQCYLDPKSTAPGCKKDGFESSQLRGDRSHKYRDLKVGKTMAQNLKTEPKKPLPCILSESSKRGIQAIIARMM